MALWNLIQYRRGKESVVMTDSLPRVQARRKQLLDSQRGGIRRQRVNYEVRPAPDDAEKFYQQPHDCNKSGQHPIPPRIGREGKL